MTSKSESEPGTERSAKATGGSTGWKVFTRIVIWVGVVCVVSFVAMCVYVGIVVNSANTHRTEAPELDRVEMQKMIEEIKRKIEPGSGAREIVLEEEDDQQSDDGDMVD